MEKNALKSMDCCCPTIYQSHNLKIIQREMDYMGQNVFHFLVHYSLHSPHCELWQLGLEESFHSTCFGMFSVTHVNVLHTTPKCVFHN